MTVLKKHPNFHHLWKWIAHIFTYFNYETNICPELKTNKKPKHEYYKSMEDKMPFPFLSSISSLYRVLSQSSKIFLFTEI